MKCLAMTSFSFLALICQTKEQILDTPTRELGISKAKKMKYLRERLKIFSYDK